jgi:predicted RNase H-like HicB family nuclease
MSHDDYAINIFWSDEDGEYIAIVPDLRGCSASGATPEEALREIQIAKGLWLESARAHSDPIPEARWRPEEPAKATG